MSTQNMTSKKINTRFGESSAFGSPQARRCGYSPGRFTRLCVKDCPNWIAVFCG